MNPEPWTPHPQVLLNPERYGYYRSNYSSVLWGELIGEASVPRSRSALSSNDLAGEVVGHRARWLVMV